MMLSSSGLRRCALCVVALATCLLAMEPAVAQRPGGDRRAGDSGERRGGDSGGRRSSRGRGGGPPGGFDPTFILQRMDRNGNGRLDPDEIDGRAKFMIERFAPGVDTSKSISFDEMRRKIQEARERRDERSGGDRRGGDRRSNEQPNIEIEPLVPGFGEEIDLEPVPGFGGSGAFFAVKVIPPDEAEADRTLGRYDRNRNGKLDREEVRQGRWSDDPTIYDQNGDGALTKRELAVRYAKRRIAREDERENDRRERARRRRDADRERQDRDRNEEDEQEQRKSYRFLTAHERLPAGIPDWFRQKDIDLDGQVRMNEYSNQWDNEMVAAFMAIDANGDGMLSPAEVLARGEEAASSSNSESGGSEEGNDGQEIPQKYLSYAKSTIKKYDKNGDTILSQEEVAAMRRPPENADQNGDGKITAEEFARAIMR